MTYVFDTDLACKYGQNEAVILANIVFWIKYNKANGTNHHDGHYWTWNSCRAWAELFPFWSAKQVRRILASLVSQGVLIRGNYNKKRYDRTFWYALADEEAFVGVDKNPVPKRANGCAQTVTPIPLINSDNKHKKEPQKVQASLARPSNLNKIAPNSKKEAPSEKNTECNFDRFFANTRGKPKTKEQQERELTEWEQKRTEILTELEVVSA